MGKDGEAERSGTAASAGDKMDLSAGVTSEGNKAEGSGAAAAKDQKAQDLHAAAAKDQKTEDLHAAAAAGENTKGTRDRAEEGEKAEDVVTATAQRQEEEKAMAIVAAKGSTQSAAGLDATALISQAFGTIEKSVDPASRKEVDAMIVQSLQSVPEFKEMFYSALLNTSVRKPFARLRVLKWSSFLVKLMVLSEEKFIIIANSQAKLFQTVMAEKIRRRRCCKRIFIQLFKSCEVLRMYLKVVTGSTFRVDTSSSFLKLLIDYTVAKSELFLEYKDKLLSLYIRAVFDPNDKENKRVKNAAFHALLSNIDSEGFGNSLFVTCLKSLSNNPKTTTLQSVQYLLDSLSCDLGEYSPIFMPLLLSLYRHSDEQRSQHALTVIGTLSERCEKQETLSDMLKLITEIIEGSEGELSRPYQIIGMINALAQLTRSAAMNSRSSTIQQRSIVVASVSTSLISFYKDDGIKEVKLAVLFALRSWVSVLIEAAEPKLVSFMKIGLQEKDYNLRAGHLELIRVVCKCSDSLTNVIPLVEQLINVAKQSFLKAELVDAIYALFGISKIIAIDKEASTHWEDTFWALIRQNEASFISVQLLSELSEEHCCTVLELLKSLLVDHISRVQEYSYTHLLLNILIRLVCHESQRVRKVACGAAKDVLLAGSAVLAEDLFDSLINWLSTKPRLENGAAIPNTQQTEVIVKCLILVGRYTIEHYPKAYSKLLLCCHHPCVATPDHSASVWKRLVRSLKLYRFICIDLEMIQTTMKELLSRDDCRSNKLISDAVFNSLQTLTRVIPKHHGQGTEDRLSKANAASARTRKGLSTPKAEKNQLVTSNGPTPKTEDSKMVPMSKKAFISFLKASASATVGATTSANVFVATWPIWSGSANKANKISLGVTLFFFIPWAVATAEVTHSAEEDENWLGYASTMVLVELIYGICLGAITATALPAVEAATVIVIATFLVVCILAFWSQVFSHPKWLRSLVWSPYSDVPQQQKSALDVGRSFISKLRKWFKRGKEPRQQESETESIGIKISM